MSYSVSQWLLFFFIYCFIGWVYESIYVSIKNRKLTNRGFMRGPFLPIYGSGAIVMLWVGLPLKGQPVLMFFAGLISASTLEFATGAVMERLFRVRYWDYSKCFLNIKGHVCLKASLAWGTFTLLLNYFIHRPVEKAVFTLSDTGLQTITLILLIYFVADFSLAFKTALDLRDVIIALEKFKDELERMEKRLDVAIAFAQNSSEQAVEAVAARMENNKRRLEERMDMIEERIDIAKEKLMSMDDIIAADIEKTKKELLEQITEIRVSNAIMRNRLKESAKRRGVLYRNMVRNNHLYTGRFMDSLEEIIKRVDEFKKD